MVKAPVTGCIFIVDGAPIILGCIFVMCVGDVRCDDHEEALAAVDRVIFSRGMRWCDTHV